MNEHLVIGGFCVQVPTGPPKKMQRIVILLIWWKIDATSLTNATGSIWKRGKTPTSELAKPGPWRRTSFNNKPLVLAAQSNTTCTLPLRGCLTAWCGKYQTTYLEYFQQVPVEHNHSRCNFALFPRKTVASLDRAATVLWVKPVDSTPCYDCKVMWQLSSKRSEPSHI